MKKHIRLLLSMEDGLVQSVFTDSNYDDCDFQIIIADHDTEGAPQEVIQTEQGREFLYFTTSTEFNPDIVKDYFDAIDKAEPGELTEREKNAHLQQLRYIINEIWYRKAAAFIGLPRLNAAYRFFRDKRTDGKFLNHHLFTHMDQVHKGWHESPEEMFWYHVSENLPLTLEIPVDWRGDTTDFLNRAADRIADEYVDKLAYDLAEFAVKHGYYRYQRPEG